MKTQPERYGTMFSDLSKLEFNAPNEGKAFTVLVESSMGITFPEHSTAQTIFHEPATAQR